MTSSRGIVCQQAAYPTLQISAFGDGGHHAPPVVYLAECTILLHTAGLCESRYQSQAGIGFLYQFCNTTSVILVYFRQYMWYMLCLTSIGIIEELLMILSSYCFYSWNWKFAIRFVSRSLLCNITSEIATLNPALSRGRGHQPMKSANFAEAPET